MIQLATDVHKMRQLLHMYVTSLWIKMKRHIHDANGALWV